MIGGSGSDQFTAMGSVVLPVFGAALDDPFVLTDPTHSLSGLQGPLQIEGGDTGSDGTIDPAVLLPGETDVPLTPLPPDPPEDTQIDLLDVHDDRLDVTLRDYAVRIRDARDHSRLWETVRSGLKKWVRVGREPVTIGTLTLDATGAVTRRSGILLPYRR